MTYLNKVINGIKMRSQEDILKPYPNEHACRIRDPNDFQKGHWARKNITNGVDIITGWLKGQTTMTTQAYRFKTSVFTEAEARKWSKDHKLTCILFEPASKSLNQVFFENLKF